MSSQLFSHRSSSSFSRYLLWLDRALVLEQLVRCCGIIWVRDRREHVEGQLLLVVRP